MSDFGYRPPKINLLDKKLTLSPETQRIIAEIEAKMKFKTWVEAMKSPDWDPILPDLHAIILPGSLAPPQPEWLKMPPAKSAALKPDPDPVTPHPGEAKDVLKAIYQTEPVQRGVKLVTDEAEKRGLQLLSEFKAAPTGEKVGMISVSVLVAAGIIGPILAVRDTRQMAFGLIKDNWLDVPYVPGFKVKFMDEGGGVTVPLGVKGLTLEAESKFLAAGRPTTVMFQFDLMEFGRRKK